MLRKRYGNSVTADAPAMSAGADYLTDLQTNS